MGTGWWIGKGEGARCLAVMHLAQPVPIPLPVSVIDLADGDLLRCVGVVVPRSREKEDVFVSPLVALCQVGGKDLGDGLEKSERMRLEIRARFER